RRQRSRSRAARSPRTWCACPSDRRARPGPRRRAARPAGLGHSYDTGTDLVRPSRDAWDHHPLHGDVCAARCHGEADAGRPGGAGWVVPRKYVEKVGEAGFKKAPIGAGPYKFVSFTPGIELVMEANEQYWRKVPSVKRIVFKVIPEATTRLAALKGGEVDIVYA